MSVAFQTHPKPRRAEIPFASRRLFRFTVEQYERMSETGILGPGDRVELLEGWIVEKMTHNPPHATALDLAQELLRGLLPAGWRLREQKPIRIPGSEPEPDLCVVRGPVKRYAHGHPTPADIALVVEVAESSLEDDRKYKGGIYARARIPVYWIINLEEAKVEVYIQPKGGKTPGYQQRQDYGIKEAVPLVIEGREIGLIPVSELLP
jgi:Uma2 family endonuclease